MTRSDADLVQDTLEGHSQAFEEIVRRYQRLVFSIIYHYLGRREEVEDLAQDVFLKVYNSLPRFDTRRSLKAWISRITANRCLDELRRSRARKTDLFSDLSEEEEARLWSLHERSGEGDNLTEVEAAESFRLLQKALDQLPEKDRMAFVLREMESMDYSEIAEVMKSSELAVRVRVSRSRKKLHDLLEGILHRERKPI